MKFGICCDASKLQRLSPGTLDYLEMNLSKIVEMTEEQLRESAELCRTFGTPAEATNGFFPAEIRLCGKDYRRDTVVEYVKRAMDRADFLGIHLCVIGSGRSRHIDEGENEQSCRRQFEEALLLSADIAQTHGSTIVLEPLRALETNLLNTVAEGAEICRRLSHPHLKLLADLYHVAAAGESPEVLTENADILHHVHIANLENRYYPQADDGMDYMPYVRALKAGGYDGRVSIEGTQLGDFTAGTTASIAFLRRLFA